MKCGALRLATRFNAYLTQQVRLWLLFPAVWSAHPEIADVARSRWRGAPGAGGGGGGCVWQRRPVHTEPVGVSEKGAGSLAKDTV